MGFLMESPLELANNFGIFYRIIKKLIKNFKQLKNHQVRQINMRKKIQRTYQQKLECLRKAIINSKEHIRNGDPTRIYSQYLRYCMDEFSSQPDFQSSVEAKELKRKDVTLEHVVPHSFIMNKLLSLEELTNENIKSVIQKFHIICRITKDEDKRLNRSGLRSKMPDDWDEENGSLYARYEKVGILLDGKDT